LVDGPRIWAGGVDGVFGIDRGTGAIVESVVCDVAMAHVRTLHKDARGALWMGHAAGLSRKDSEGCKTFTRADGLPDDRVNAMMVDGKGRLWVGTWGGAAILEDGHWSAMRATDGLADDMVSVMMADHRGFLWFGSAVAPRGGLTICREGACRVFDTSRGLPHNAINALVETREGDVWVATGLLSRGGAVRFHFDGEWRVAQVLTQADGLAGAKVRSLFEDAAGALWVGSETSGIVRIRAGHVMAFTVQDGLSHDEVKVIVEDSDSQLWMGTRDGVTRIDGSALSSLDL
jgi:ligand-binding sensor domain-containing protein